MNKTDPAPALFNEFRIVELTEVIGFISGALEGIFEQRTQHTRALIFAAAAVLAGIQDKIKLGLPLERPSVAVSRQTDKIRNRAARRTGALLTELASAEPPSFMSTPVAALTHAIAVLAEAIRADRYCRTKDAEQCVAWALEGLAVAWSAVQEPK